MTPLKAWQSAARQEMSADRWQIRRPVWPHVFMALLGFGWAFSIDIGVKVYGAEIVSVIGVFLVTSWTTVRRYPMARRVLGAYALWVVAIALSDIVNNSDIFNSLRHIATPIIGATSLVFALAVLARKPSAVLTFLVAMVIGKAAFGEPLYGDQFADRVIGLETILEDTNFFKVRIDPFLTPAIVLLGSLVGRRNLLHAALVFALASIGYLGLDSRSIGLVFFLAAMILVAVKTGFRPSAGQIIVMVFLIAAIGYGGYVSYVSYTLAFNPDGHNGQQLQQIESPYNPLLLLLQGRSEWLVMPIAFFERPLFGWGSWAEDPSGRFTSLRNLSVNSFGNSVWRDSTYIPVHSLLGSAFVWSGTLGLLSMVLLLRSIWAMSKRLMSVKSDLLPAVIFYLVLVLWHFFFSPPQHVRLSFPVALAVLIVVTGAQPRSMLRREKRTEKLEDKEATV